MVVRPLFLKEVGLDVALEAVIFGKNEGYSCLLDELRGKCIYNVFIVFVVKPELMKIGDESINTAGVLLSDEIPLN